MRSKTFLKLNARTSAGVPDPAPRSVVHGCRVAASSAAATGVNRVGTVSWSPGCRRGDQSGRRQQRCRHRGGVGRAHGTDAGHWPSRWTGGTGAGCRETGDEPSPWRGRSTYADATTTPSPPSCRPGGSRRSSCCTRTASMRWSPPCCTGSESGDVTCTSSRVGSVSTRWWLNGWQVRRLMHFLAPAIGPNDKSRIRASRGNQ
jgi:hypothetical protein